MPHSIRNAYVDTPRGQLHVRRCGEGKAILLLQILPFSSALLEGLMHALAQAGYAAHTIDLMGYGRSDPRATDWQVEDFANDLIAALTALALCPHATIAGHFTAMVAVQASLVAPGSLGRLVLDGVPLWSREVAMERLSKDAPRPPWGAAGTDAAQAWQSVVQLLQRFDPELSFAPENQARLFAAFSHFVAIGLSPGATAAIMRYDLAAALPRLRTPTLVIGSPTDSLRDRHERAVAAIPGAHSHLFSDVHPLYRLHAPERATDYVRAIHAFLEHASP